MASTYKESLQAERAMCAAAGKDDRVAAIDAELERLGRPAPLVQSSYSEGPDAPEAAVMEVPEAAVLPKAKSRGR